MRPLYLPSFIINPYTKLYLTASYYWNPRVHSSTHKCLIPLISLKVLTFIATPITIFKIMPLVVGVTEPHSPQVLFFRLQLLGLSTLFCLLVPPWQRPYPPLIQFIAFSLFLWLKNDITKQNNLSLRLISNLFLQIFCSQTLFIVPWDLLFGIIWLFIHFSNIDSHI